MTKIACCGFAISLLLLGLASGYALRRSERLLRSLRSGFASLARLCHLFDQRANKRMRIEDLIKSGKTLALAESCTGGAIAAKLTAVAGASNFLLGSIVAYSNAWKIEFLGVNPATLETKGAVSREVVEEMVLGLFARTSCDIAAAVSGIAGPTGNPVGTVYIAVAKRGGPVQVQLLQAKPPRANIIETAALTTLKAIYDLSIH